MEELTRIMRSYPHQLSGGLRQRAMIGQAFCAGPKLIFADEPTSNLDVTIQANILDLFRKLKDELKLTMLLITHDLGVVKHLADETAILYAGKVVDFGKTQDVLTFGQHPFTRELLENINS